MDHGFLYEAHSECRADFLGAVGGALALAGIGFSYGGWMTGGRAAEFAQRQADSAVTAALAPICVENFRHAENAEGNLRS